MHLASRSLSIIPLALLTLSLALVIPLAGEARPWKNSDGQKSILAEFLSRDESTVTLRKADGRVLTFSIEKLHQDEQDFLNKNHPHLAPKEEEEPVGDAFGPLRFGDSRDEVEDKLSKSAIVKTTVDKGLFGRTGLNGIFETTEGIGGLHCFLYFDWSDAGNLREVTLRTNGLDGPAYTNKLRATWSELIELLNKLYGKPLSMAPYPKQEELQDGLMLASHLWRTGDGYSVLLGPGQEQKKYNVSVRFTTKRIQPNVVP